MNERSPWEKRQEALATSEHPRTAEDTHITKGLDDRKQVERTADRIRDELLLTLEELDRRRDQALDLRHQISKHRDVIVGAVITAAIVTAVSVGVAMWRSRHRERILARQRMSAFKRAWQHPDRVASSAEERPLPVALGRKLILIFGTTLASAVAKNAVQGLVPQRSSQSAGG